MFHLLTTMQVRQSSLLNRGATTIRIDIYQPSLGSSKTWPGPASPKSTVHLQSSPWPQGYTLLSLSLHSQCVVGRSHDSITEVLGLPVHVISYKVSKHRRAYNGTVLNRHNRRHYIGTPFPMQVHRPISNYPHHSFIQLFYNNPSNFAKHFQSFLINQG
jgi:hypothetical protein